MINLIATVGGNGTLQLRPTANLKPAPRNAWVFYAPSQVR